MATDAETEAVEQRLARSRRRHIRYRRDQFYVLGFSLVEAEMLADDERVNLHLAQLAHEGGATLDQLRRIFL